MARSNTHRVSRIRAAVRFKSMTVRQVVPVTKAVEMVAGAAKPHAG